MISTHDEALLGWYFGQGQCAFERSTVGAMLEHAELFGNAHIGWAFSARDGREVVQFERLRRDPTPWGRVHDGEIVYSGREVTARPTAETRTASGYTPHLKTMERYAEVSRVLRLVERQSQVARHALEAYHGDLGVSWARERKPGKLASLYHLTQAGSRLLAASANEALAKGQPVIGAPERRMANEIARKEKPERVRVGLQRCDHQAGQLLRDAHALWCESQRELERGRAA